ncbi:hypothetical protein SDC9_207124 [bioreactor metagenome]|uniref:Uncharacterized protein n=1 Tax=bioreactor metagenome TaxID=1076179 RepID=A0A645JIG1_9ZZZZ
MPHVQVHQLGRHVGITVSVGIVVIDALAAHHGHGVDGLLLGPGMQIVGKRKFLDFLSGHDKFLQFTRTLLSAYYFSRSCI